MAATALASDLQFPEGPVALPDGSVLVVEIRGERVTRIWPDGTSKVVAHVPGGPNGLAMGPDGWCWVCNNGGFSWHEVGGTIVPGHQPASYRGGSIDRVNIETGQVETVYDSCEGLGLRGPNDLVFDRTGGLWFTDLGKRRKAEHDIGAVYYARDGIVRRMITPMERPNGIGLSPQENRLYVAETPTGRIWEYQLSAPGEIKPLNGPYRNDMGRVLIGLPGYQMFDSLAVEAGGNICVATLVTGCISVISPEGALLEQVAVGDNAVTNIAFGGADMRTAFITLSGRSELLALPWPRPGLKLNFSGA